MYRILILRRLEQMERALVAKSHQAIFFAYYVSPPHFKAIIILSFSLPQETKCAEHYKPRKHKER